MLRAGVLAALLAGSSVIGGPVGETVTPTSTATGTGTSSATATGTGTGTAGSTADVTPTRTETRTPTKSRSQSASPSSTPLTCSNPYTPVRVQLLNNIFPLGGDDVLEPVVLPAHLQGFGGWPVRRALAAVGDPTKLNLPDSARRELQAYTVQPMSYDPQLSSIQFTGEPHHWHCPDLNIEEALRTGFGAVALTDGQRASVRFSAPCVAPCSFSLSDITMLLSALPPWFLSSADEASVVFKFELGRYYYKPDAAHQQRRYSQTSQRRELEEIEETEAAEARARGLTYAGPGVIVDWEHSGGAVWSDHMRVQNHTRAYTLGLGDLHYDIPTQCPFDGYLPGDFKLMLTPYISYDRRRCPQPRDQVEQSPQQIRWSLSSEEGARKPSTIFSDAGGFDLLPVCPSTTNGQVTGLAQNNRALHISQQWFPDVCLGTNSEFWSCSGIFPGLTLNGFIPCGQAYDKLREEERRIESSASRTPSATPSGDPPADDVVPLDDAAVRMRRRLNNWPPQDNQHWCPTCPMDVDSQDLPFKGADNTAEGRFLSPWYDSLRTQTVSGGMNSDLLLVFPVPCKRCKISMRHVWVPLAADHLPRAPGAANVCFNVINFATSVGFWNGGFGTNGGYLPDGSAWNWNSFNQVGQTVITRVELNPGNQQHLPKVTTTQLFLGTQSGPADISINDEQFLAIRIRADSCYLLGGGLSAFLDDWDGNPHNGGCEHDNTPVALFKPVGGRWSYHRDFIPGLFAPVFQVNTAEPPLCSPKPSASASATPWPTKSKPANIPPSPSHSCTPSRSHGAYLSPSTGVASGTDGKDTGSTDNNGNVDASSAGGLSGGGIAGVVIGVLVGLAIVAAIAVFAVARFKKSRADGAAATASRPAPRPSRRAGSTGATADRRTPAATGAAAAGASHSHSQTVTETQTGATDASGVTTMTAGGGGGDADPGATPSTMRNRRAGGGSTNLA